MFGPIMIFVRNFVNWGEGCAAIHHPPRGLFRLHGGGVVGY